MAKHHVLLIGSGGREHAIAWKLNQSNSLGTLYLAPGNPGMNSLGVSVELNLTNFEEVVRFCREKEIDLVIVGPEQPLVDGIVDYLEENDIAAFGPRKDAAKLEGSKEFAKEFMKRYQIPTADYRTFSSDQFDQALNYIREQNQYPVVLKADGLAGGKGVFICESEKEAEERLVQYSQDSTLSDASAKVVVEEFMQGEEASVFVISDGYTAKIIHHAQDHKRAGEADTGLNTGGMGAYSPAPVLTDKLMDRIEKEIVLPTITGMQLDGTPYKGILYVGLMITDNGPKVVEYNCRFGDPECQVILPSMKSDLLELMLATEDQRLDEKELLMDNLFHCCVVIASGGYPVSYEKGKIIEGADNLDANALLFHAGTAINDEGAIVSSGGRVLNVIGRGKNLQEAIEHTYRNVEKVSFEQSFYRRDIGKKGLLHTTGLS